MVLLCHYKLLLVGLLQALLLFSVTTTCSSTAASTPSSTGSADYDDERGAPDNAKQQLRAKTASSSVNRNHIVVTHQHQHQQQYQRHLQSPQRIRLDVPDCSFRVTQKCTVHGDDLPEQGVDCETFTPPMLVVETCQATPYTVTLLYNGGTCEQTDNADVLGIRCQDGGHVDGESPLASQFDTSTTTTTTTDAPPVQEGEESYIIVTDAFNLGIIYHTGLVAVGSQYTLNSNPDQQQQLMEYGFMIRIFDKKDPTKLLQHVIYDKPLCSSQLEAANRFGASQIVQYTNAPQGRVSLFRSYQVNVELDVSFALTGRLHTAAVDSLIFMTNFAGYIDLTNDVRGKMIQPGQPLTVTIDVDVDLYEKRRNTLLTQISVGGSYCMGTDFLAFTTGGAAGSSLQGRRRVYN